MSDMQLDYLEESLVDGKRLNRVLCPLAGSPLVGCSPRGVGRITAGRAWVTRCGTLATERPATKHCLLREISIITPLHHTRPENVPEAGKANSVSALDLCKPCLLFTIPALKPLQT